MSNTNSLAILTIDLSIVNVEKLLLILTINTNVKNEFEVFFSFNGKNPNLGDYTNVFFEQIF